jgi:ribosomal protein S12 methylthiotransferase accessory factor
VLLPEAATALKSYTYGTHRFRSPEETFRLIRQHFTAIGITRVADVTGLDSIDIPVCVAVRPNSRSLAVSQGKGITPIHAKVSAAMESIELYHAEQIDLRDSVVATFTDMRERAMVCDPRALPLHPHTNYCDDLPIRWVKGYDIIAGVDTFVPYDLVHCVWVGSIDRPPAFAASSTGLASGNHPLEAIFHAICEVIERHETYIWQLKTLLPTKNIERVALDSINSPMCRELLEKLHAANISVYIWNIASTFTIPCFGCALIETAPVSSFLPVGVFHGFGCHLSKEIALIRAVTEAVQTRLTFISGARDDTYREHYDLTQCAFYQARWMDLLQKRAVTIDFRTLVSFDTDRFDSDIQVLLGQLQQRGYTSAIAIDLTKPQLGIPVVRIIIPGLKDA